MKTCHHCSQPWGAHDSSCRVPADLDRMRRVADRLATEGREPELLARIRTYLGEFGRLPCQRRDGLPGTADCAGCGYGEVCVILPEPVG